MRPIRNRYPRKSLKTKSLPFIPEIVSFLEHFVAQRTDRAARIRYTICMRSSYNISTPLYTPSMETLMSNPFNDPLSHTGNEMLSGMNVKPSAVTQAEIDAFLAKGGEIKQIKSKAVRKHSPRSKSHQMGGKHSRYNMGGRNSKKSRSASYTKHA